ncbi:MAG: 50S ribosomal protein L24 [Candidatus Eisenbacteria bacterium]|uniref:Large ribosomal subunit protein uL24 n=1 Tax=Eiseniibacteriota bacterium TaxID=2212470 RepID=A0A956NHL8_UNCEI|nr:50S ribosomal protein L24 [Candidatus Eisenbacteria bacterium]MCB9463618.1 50S ribosomal protein L24 [Candidatus Eisenbacteria bacterium]
MMKIRKGDKVIVLSGDDKGRTGKVIHVDPDKHKVIVEKVRLVKRHHKPGRLGIQGGILEKEAFIPVSKVALVDKKGNPTRVRMETQKDGSRARVAVTTGETIDTPKG